MGSEQDNFAAMLANQAGAAGGLWTHTPTDWRGNEAVLLQVDPEADQPPQYWPEDAADAIPPGGSRGSVPDPEELGALPLPPAPWP
jgi:hypothetical protein